MRFYVANPTVVITLVGLKRLTYREMREYLMLDFQSIAWMESTYTQRLNKGIPVQIKITTIPKHLRTKHLEKKRQ